MNGATCGFFRYRLPCPIWIVMSVLLAAIPAPARGPVDVADGDFRDAVARQLGLEAGRLARGRVMAALSGEPPALIVFLDGTEIGRLDNTRAEALLRAFPARRSELLAAPSARGEGAPAAAGFWQGAFKGKGALRRLGGWEEKLSLGYHLDYLYSDILVRRGRAEASVFKRFGFVYLGADVAHLSFKGELPDSVSYAADAGRVGAGATAGFDFLRYHLRYAPFALPGYFWTEHGLKQKYFDRDTPAGRTEVVRIFEADAPPVLEHEVEVKVGWMRYSLTYAPDVYKSPLHAVAFDDLPGVLGTWGMGLIATPAGVIPGGWYRFDSIRLANLSLGGGAFPLRLSPGRIAYFRSDNSQFQLAWNGEMTFGFKGSGP